jgi:hypothetical protein
MTVQVSKSAVVAFSHDRYGIICCTGPGLTWACTYIDHITHVKHVKCKDLCTYWQRLWTMTDKNRPDLSSERAHEQERTETVKQLTAIWSWAPDGARHQDILTDGPSVAKGLWLYATTRHLHLICRPVRLPSLAVECRFFLLFILTINTFEHVCIIYTTPLSRKCQIWTRHKNMLTYSCVALSARITLP